MKIFIISTLLIGLVVVSSSYAYRIYDKAYSIERKYTWNMINYCRNSLMEDFGSNVEGSYKYFLASNFARKVIPLQSDEIKLEIINGCAK